MERLSDGYQLIASLMHLYHKIHADGTIELVVEWAWSKEIGWQKIKAEPVPLLKINHSISRTIKIMLAFYDYLVYTSNCGKNKKASIGN